MNYEKLTPVLVKAIQEQQAIILKQQNALEGINSRLAELESKLGSN